MLIKTLEQIPSNWRLLEREGGEVTQKGPLVLKVPPTEEDKYTNAQIDDYPGMKRSAFKHTPPLKIEVNMRRRGEGFRGTAGFGLWNDPFLMTEPRWPTLPKAIWFFESSLDSNMDLAQNIPGYGWKCGTLDAWRWPFLSLIPTLPLSLPLMYVPLCRKLLWPVAQKAMCCHETMIPNSITEWHTYTIEWLVDKINFYVDGVLLQTGPSVRGPLAFVLWIDNQFMCIDPRGKLTSGHLKLETSQSLEVASIEIERC